MSHDEARPAAVAADRHGRLAPPPELLAAIEAAVTTAWPRPATAAGGRGGARTPAWRFSGRWWGAPVPLRRDRP